MTQYIDNQVVEQTLTENALVAVPTSTVTASGILALTAASTMDQRFTGSTTGQVLRLPDATTVALGQRYEVFNAASVSIAVQDGSGAPLIVVQPNQLAIFRNAGISSVAGVWYYTSLDQSMAANDQLYCSYPAVTIANPVGAPGTSTATSGGTIPAGTYKVAYTYTYGNGETASSPEATQVTTGATSTLTVTPGALPANVTSVKVYVTAAGGGTGTETFQQSYTTGTNVVLTSLSVGAAIPTTNTTGLVVNYLAGVAYYGGTEYVIAAGNIAVLPSITGGFIYVDPITHVVTSAATLPNNAMPMAVFTSSSSAVTALNDARREVDSNLVWAVSGDIQAQTSQSTVSAGALEKYARGDHKHAMNINLMKSGVVASGSFAGTPQKTAAVVFATAFADTAYEIKLSGVDARTLTYQSKATTGFTINTNANQALTGEVSWTATKTGEAS